MRANNFSRYTQVLLWGGYLAFVLVSLILTLTHEPWIDEIYAWQISKMSIPGIVYEMRYEGHFALWYLILYPFSHSGCPLKAMGIISWIINAVSILYFIRKAPFRWWAKLAMLLSFPFIYQLPVISRCYVLIPLFLFPLATHLHRIMHADRDDALNKEYAYCGILLAFLSNTHLYLEGLVFIVSLYLLVQSVKDWKGLDASGRRCRVLSLLIVLTGVLIAFLQVYPSLESSAVFDETAQNTIGWLEFLKCFALHHLPISISLLLLLLALVYIGIRNVFAAVAFIVSNAFIMLIGMLAYWSPSAGSQFWFYLLVFSLWLIGYRDSPPKVPLSSMLLLVFSVFMIAVSPLIRDLKTYYGGESRFADFLKANVDEDVPIFSNPNSWCCAIIEYLPDHRFYNVRDLSELCPRKDLAPLDSLKSASYLEQAFRKDTTAQSLYLMDCALEEEDYIKRYNLPYEYEILYPKTDEQKGYFLQYYLLKVHRQ